MGHDGAVQITAEFIVETLSDGVDVLAAIQVAESAGLAVDVGPFGTTVVGESGLVLRTVDGLVRAAIDSGATRVSLQLTVG